ncbi:MAG TPA: DUF1572 family protein [Pyrinomonadaceae bacterium]|jgi:hypothetical protein
MKQIIENYPGDALEAFRGYKSLAEKALAQTGDEEFFRLIDPEANSIAVIVKHLAGNLSSRWTDFLTTDGEKTDRNRDAEFELTTDTRDELMRFWENGWQTLFDTLESLHAEDLEKTVQIRGEDFTVVKAISRSLAHTAYHIGQITLLAKHYRSSEWQTLSIPKNKSAEFAAWLSEKKEKGNYLKASEEFNEKDLR